jgi:hypothetical protein
VRDCCFAVPWECELNFYSETLLCRGFGTASGGGFECEEAKWHSLLVTVDMMQRPRVGGEFILKYPLAFFQKFTDTREFRGNTYSSGMGDSACSNTGKANEPKTDTFSSAPTSIPRILNN